MLLFILMSFIEELGDFNMAVSIKKYLGMPLIHSRVTIHRAIWWIKFKRDFLAGIANP